MSSRAMLIAIATSKDLKGTKDPDRVEGIGWCRGEVLKQYHARYAHVQCG